MGATTDEILTDPERCAYEKCSEGMPIGKRVVVQWFYRFFKKRKVPSGKKFFCNDACFSGWCRSFFKEESLEEIE